MYEQEWLRVVGQLPAPLALIYRMLLVVEENAGNASVKRYKFEYIQDNKKAPKGAFLFRRKWCLFLCHFF
ncbi:MAG: hypothetical protein OEY29_06785 [Gammaproteobacteria bacterium]|nr:hypothetical protein [Gammaproteobacteria bacterium]